MRKLSIPAAVLIFFTAAAPAFAAPPFWEKIGLGPVYDFFNFGRYRSASVSSDRNDFGENQRLNPTIFIQPSGSMRPTDAGRPTDKPRPTDRGQGNDDIRDTFDRQTGKPTDKVKPTDGDTQNNGQPKSNRAQKLKETIARMLDNYQQRLNKYNEFLSKVKSRRDKLAGEGKDITKLNEFIITATDNLNTAVTVLSNVKKTLGNLNLTGDMGDLRKTIHEQTTLVRQAMTTLHASMSEVVDEIVNQSGGAPTPLTTITGKPGNRNNENKNNNGQNTNDGKDNRGQGRNN